MSIKELAEDDRPREKFLSKGRNVLSDSELLAIILGSGNADETAVEVSRKILASVGGSWQRLSQLSVRDLMKFRGVGPVKAIGIAAALEIGNRRAAQEIPDDPAIGNSQESYKIFRPYLSDLRTEEFWAIFVNQRNKVLHKCRISQGGITSSAVDVRVLFNLALQHFATGFIIAHNHPSGNPKPSRDDISATEKIVAAGKILNISLLDHLVIAQDTYFSFSDEGLL